MNQNNSKPRPDVGAFAGVQSRIAAISSILEQLGEDAILATDLEDISIRLRALSSAVAYATPTLRCPFCFGRGDGCRFCGGIGWVSSTKIRLAPQELIDAAAALKELEQDHA